MQKRLNIVKKVKNSYLKISGETGILSAFCANYTVDGHFKRYLQPSVMLAEMLKYCPAGESTTTVFEYLFLQQLPREIRMLLSEDDPADVRPLRTRPTASS